MGLKTSSWRDCLGPNIQAGRTLWTSYFCCSSSSPCCLCPSVVHMHSLSTSRLCLKIQDQLAALNMGQLSTQLYTLRKCSSAKYFPGLATHLIHRSSGQARILATKLNKAERPNSWEARNFTFFALGTRANNSVLTSRSNIQYTRNMTTSKILSTCIFQDLFCRHSNFLLHNKTK